MPMGAMIGMGLEEEEGILVMEMNHPTVLPYRHYY
jgi:hypothetical protein